MIDVYLHLDPFGIWDELEFEQIPRKGEYYNVKGYKQRIIKAWDIPKNIHKHIGSVFYVDEVLWEDHKSVSVTLIPVDYLDDNRVTDDWTRLEWEDWYTKRSEGNQ